MTTRRTQSSTRDAAMHRALDGLRRTVRMLRVAERRADRTAGLSMAQLYVLQKLADQPASSLNELAARTYTDQSSVSVVVSRLVKRGLVKREPAEGDRRRIVIALSTRGRNLLRRAPEPAQEHLLDAMKQLSAPQLKALARSLETLVEALGVAEEPAGMFFED